MSTLSQELDRYLSIRRSLGYKLSTEERILRKFVAFAERENAESVSTAIFLRWKDLFGKVNKQTWAHRLGMARLFALWLHSMDSKHEVPPRSLIPSRIRRPHPYIYSEDDIRRIVEAAAELPSINGIRALTCSTLFGLIAVTGLRVSEALSLHASDIDLENGVVTLRQGKLGKARLLPVPKHGSPITPRNGTDFSELLQLRSSFQIGVSVSLTAALDITSPWSASRSDCGHRKSSTDMDVGPVFMIYVIRLQFERW